MYPMPGETDKGLIICAIAAVGQYLSWRGEGKGKALWPDNIPNCSVFSSPSLLPRCTHGDRLTPLYGSLETL